ncbi:MAG: aldo/keto reductase [Ardenticatenaceae bacterium]|nr:aldo/keto reductase [Anaerolineales bacterium]MCB8922167.1 aldo/keto reductase [Ardenticatenaceae bacterium]MCB8991148.1 aldo/keto reductase [Ardenticatenaceae bacterium]MCB9005302.1 aldo/keto reductase [Ardenticatenaceae bacterium]
MEYKQLGRTDLNVSRICLGTAQFGWTADKPTTFTILSEFVEQGGSFLDTADAYSFWAKDNPGGVSEQWIGDWFKQSGLRRDQFIIATKVGLRMWEGADGAGLNRAHIMRAAEESLRRLQVETIDLYLAHWPDDAVPIEETLRAFDDLVQQGKVRVVGCSNYSAAQLRAALDTGSANGLARFDVVQPEYNLMRRKEYEGALMDLYAAEQLGVMTYSSLARGFLAGKYRPGTAVTAQAMSRETLRPYLTPRCFAVLDELERVALARGATMTQTAVAWILANPTITSAIMGASTVTQLHKTLAGADFRLSASDKAALDDATAWILAEGVPQPDMDALLGL